MKLIFTFTQPMPPGKYTTTAIDLPDEMAQLPDAETHVLAVAQAVAALTRVNLSLTCLGLDIKNRMIKEVKLSDKEQQEVAALIDSFAETVVSFYYKGQEQAVRKLRIIAPIASPVMHIEKRSTRSTVSANTKKSAVFKDSLHRPDFQALAQYEPNQQAYYARFGPLVEHMLALLNAHPTHHEWRFQGLSPRWHDETQQKQVTKRQETAQRKVTKETTRENRRQALDEKRTIRGQIMGKKSPKAAAKPDDDESEAD